jgi:anhydro-N-acetylmuramic acid kinase
VARERYLGLMSGTSADGVDAALLHCDGPSMTLEATLCVPLAPELRAAINDLCSSGADEVERLGRLDRELGAAFAAAALRLLAEAGVTPDAVRAIGSHGQTVRHRPDGDPAFTLQIGDPNTIAEITGITTVGDFRRRDIAAGGEGAPLAPAFHRARFACAGRRRAIVNIGGIANATLLDGERLLGGFDTGPGNTLLDHWARENLGRPLDAGGAWAAGGRPIDALLTRCQGDPYFQRRGPRSTGRETFSPAWLQAQLADLADLAPRDVQATLAELTARTIVGALQRAGFAAEDIYVCGGGAHNADLLRRLRAAAQPAQVGTTAELGIDPDWVEAAAFAWLARQTVHGLAGNAPAVTGAAGERVLGAIYPGSGPAC